MSSDIESAGKLVLVELSGASTLFNLVFIILVGYCTVKAIFSSPL